MLSPPRLRKATLALCGLACVGGAASLPLPARSQRMEVRHPTELALLAPPPLPFPATGGFVVRSVPASAEGNQDPSALRLTRLGGREVSLSAEEIAPGLRRLAPPGGQPLPLGTFELTGVAGSPYTIHMGSGSDGAPGAPSVERARRAERQLRRHVRGLGDRLFPVEKVELTLAPIPEGVVAVVARWVDWSDPAGGLYGAWTPVSPGATDVVLICTAEEDCQDVHGQIPRPGERGVLRFVDAGGRISEPSSPFEVR